MISFLKGTIEYIGDKYAVISAGGVGYRVTMPPKVLNSLAKINTGVNGSAHSISSVQASSPQVGSTHSTGSTGSPQASSVQASSSPVRLFVHSQLNMREGTFDLYGFDRKEDLDLFNMLISVSGIGPKNAIGIMATVDPQHLKAAVVNEDANYLKKVSGLGPKTAQRLVLELKNKIDFLDVGDGSSLDLGVQAQAIDALMALGYTQMQAKDALKEVSSKHPALQDQVREALRILGKR